MVSPGISGGLGARGALRVESAAARRVLLSGWGRSPAGTHASGAGAVRVNLGPVNRQQLTGCAPSGRRQPTRCGSRARGARGPRRTDGSEGGGTRWRVAAAPSPPLQLATAAVGPQATASGRQRIAAPGRLSASRGARAFPGSCGAGGRLPPFSSALSRFPSALSTRVFFRPRLF